VKPAVAPKVEAKPVVAKVAVKVEAKAIETVAKPAAAKVEKKVVVSKPEEVAAPKPAIKVAEKPVTVTAKAIDTVPHAVLQVNKQKGKDDPSTHENALAAQKSADEAARHLESAKKAYEKTKANVKEIVNTGKKIENTADDIKTLYTPDKEAAKLKQETVEEKEPAPSQPAPEGPDFDLQAREQEEAQRDYFIRVVAQLIFALLYYVLIVRHYPSYRELPPPNQEAKALQEQNEVTATFHASLSNLFLSWCCSGPRAAHTFYSVLGFNYWLGCALTSCFPCCTLWYFNTFTQLNNRLGGEKRSIFMGLMCACCCSCCVIAQDAETLDVMHGLETLPWGLKKRLK